MIKIAVASDIRRYINVIRIDRGKEHSVLYAQGGSCELMESIAEDESVHITGLRENLIALRKIIDDEINSLEAIENEN